MWRYIFRRVWQMVPTVIGVILITFLLFNVAGGDIAKSTLGKHVSPKMLEEFDQQRGFNKPLFFGWWTKTRAFDDTAFDVNAGSWARVKGARYQAPSGRERGYLQLPAGASYTVPMAFALDPGTAYRLRLTYRLGPMGEVQLETEPATVQTSPKWFPLLPSLGWKTKELVFKAPPDGSYAIHVTGEDLDLSEVQLRRRVNNPFDSQLLHYFYQLSPFWPERVTDAETGKTSRRFQYIGVDFGTSINTKQRVSRMILDGIGPSLSLTTPIFLIGLCTAVFVSLLCAFFRDRFLDRAVVVVSVALMSINYIVWIIVGQYSLGYRLGWFPVWGYESWVYLLLPVLIGVISGLGIDIRFYRTIMLDEMYKDYVRTAFAKGVSKRGVLFVHVLRNALIPVVTNVVITVPFLYTGSLLLETFFGIPGLGYMAINALNSSDVDVIRAIVFIAAVLFVVFNLITDICYALVDPRVSLQ